MVWVVMEARCAREVETRVMRAWWSDRNVLSLSGAAWQSRYAHTRGCTSPAQRYLRQTWQLELGYDFPKYILLSGVEPGINSPYAVSAIQVRCEDEFIRLHSDINPVSPSDLFRNALRTGTYLSVLS